ncbi:hypothetical protein PVAG01_04916 [Phlyctema vagabunda]|uniref:FAD-binding domain-containing protein n=1 Tax=Phlyctema vagabunda TaxID=108571 RepID=A0ABR4PIK0_9HELO
MGDELQIAIVGAGPAGLTLACLLENRGINYTVFDLRSQPPAAASTAPSGSLDLHTESGLLALTECGLIEKFHGLKSDCTEDMILTDKDAQVQYQDSGAGERPEISRSDLTSLLMSSVPAGKLRWEHKLVDVEPQPGGRWQLAFHDQPTLVFDLVVGADGAWSRVRGPLTETKPHYSGIQNITLDIPQLTSHDGSLAAMVGKGSFLASAQKKAIMTQRGPQDSVRIYVMFESPTEEHFSAFSSFSTPLKAVLLDNPEYFQDWAPALKSLIEAGLQYAGEQGQSVRPRGLYMLPPGHTWTSKEGLTLVGDAAHLMTPFAGEGVNAAMLDALELSRAIDPARDREQLQHGIASYETAMWERTRGHADETWRNLQMIFADDAPRGFVEMMKSFGGE